jgi:hypothetical protein
MIRKGYATAKKGADHLWLQYWVNDEKIAETFVSHGPDQDLGPRLLGRMGKGCHLSTQEFYLFAKCIMTEKQYRQILVDKGIIKGD